MDPEDWVRTFCERIGVEQPSPTEVEALLELAATAAHASHASPLRSPPGPPVAAEVGLDRAVGDRVREADRLPSARIASRWGRS